MAVIVLDHRRQKLFDCPDKGEIVHSKGTEKYCISVAWDLITGPAYTSISRGVASSKVLPRHMPAHATMQVGSPTSLYKVSSSLNRSRNWQGYGLSEFFRSRCQFFSVGQVAWIIVNILTYMSKSINMIAFEFFD